MDEQPGNPRFRFGSPSEDLGSGFLTEYWHSSEALPRITGLEVPIYFFLQGLKNIYALPMSNAIAVTTIAVAFYLFSGFFLLIQNADNLLSRAGGSLNATVYLKDNVQDRDVNEFLRELENNPDILKVQYISSEQALELLRKDLGEQSSFLEGLEGDNPLPASVDFVLRPDALGITQIESTVFRLREKPIVDEVIFGSEWVEKFQRILQVFRYTTWLVLAVVLAIMVFIIANTIKLIVYSRRDEISIMRLVGATPGFVKFPFFLGGLFQGLIGSACSILFVYISYLLLNAEVQNTAVLGFTITGLDFLSLYQVSVLVIFGALVGGIGSLIAVRRFVDI